MNIEEALTVRQREIIDLNLEAFGADLSVSTLADFNGLDWHPKAGHVFLHVNSRNNKFDYPTDLGYFPDAWAIQSLIFNYLWQKVRI